MLVIVPLMVVVAGCLLVLYSGVRVAERQRDDWKDVADDAVSLLDRAGEQFETPGAARAWEARVARCVAHYNALLEPER